MILDPPPSDEDRDVVAVKDRVGDGGRAGSDERTRGPERRYNDIFLIFNNRAKLELA